MFHQACLGLGKILYILCVHWYLGFLFFAIAFLSLLG